MVSDQVIILATVGIFSLALVAIVAIRYSGRIMTKVRKEGIDIEVGAENRSKP